MQDNYSKIVNNVEKSRSDRFYHINMTKVGCNSPVKRGVPFVMRFHNQWASMGQI
jgi:hypothetical protein